MKNIINRIRNCKENCYKNRYAFDLKTSGGRIITKEELLLAQPLIDDWRKQKILLISQAPSKQAFVDGELSSLENNFLASFLLPKIFPLLSAPDEIKLFRKKVFWLHTSNCYPFVRSQKRKRDRMPDLRCANKYMGEVIDRLHPEFIILMGGSATKYFCNDIRKGINSQKSYPSLEEILSWQYKRKSYLKIGSKTNPEKKYRSVVVPHAADWDKLDVVARYGYMRVFEMIKD